jgi:hypothetical protein
MMFRRMLALMCVMFSSVILHSQSNNVVLGILEDLPGHYAGDPNFRDVRIVFQKKGTDWQPFPSNCPNQSCLKKISAEYPPEMKWTIAFDGRNLGQIATRTQEEFHYYSEGLQNITSGNSIPTVGRKEGRGFSNFSAYRPLVAISRPNFTDPEEWKPFSPSQGLIATLREQFRKKFPKLCRNSKGDSSKLEPFLYEDREVSLVKAYRSKAGGRSSFASIRYRLQRCGGGLRD